MKLTIRDIHQKMKELKLIGKEEVFLWGTVKRVLSKQPLLSKKNPMHALSYKDGYIYITPFTSEKIMEKSTIRINILNVFNINISKEFLTFGKRKIFTLNLKEGISIGFSVPTTYLEQMNLLKLIVSQLQK